MIKVLFLIPTLDRGGAENVLVNLVNNMDYDKFDITVQTLFDQDSQKDSLNKSIKYKSFLKKQFRGNSKLLALVPAKLLYKCIVKDEYDIVVSYLEGPTAHVLSGCPFIDTKRVAWIHVELKSDSSFSAGFSSKKKAIRAYSQYDRIVYVSQNVKTQFENTSDCVYPQGLVLYNTVDCNSIKKLAKEPIDDIEFDANETNIISVGRIVAAKGYDRLCHVHKRLIEKGIKHHIYILGAGPQQKKLEEYLKNNNLLNSFTFIGFRDNVYKYVEKADLFICCSRREGFSTAVTESIIVGTPVLSTNCSGAYELLGENNEFGVVVENSEDGLYNGLKELIQNNEMLSHYKEVSKVRANLFNTKKTVFEVEKMLIELSEANREDE